MLQPSCFGVLRRSGNRTLQNRGILLVFAHFSALDFGKRGMVNLQTQRAVLVNTARRVCQRPTLRCQIRRFRGSLTALSRVCNNSKKKANRSVCFLFEKLHVGWFGRVLPLALPATKPVRLFLSTFPALGKACFNFILIERGAEHLKENNRSQEVNHDLREHAVNHQCPRLCWCELAAFVCSRIMFGCGCFLTSQKNCWLFLSKMKF